MLNHIKDCNIFYKRDNYILAHGMVQPTRNVIEYIYNMTITNSTKIIMCLQKTERCVNNTVVRSLFLFIYSSQQDMLYVASIGRPPLVGAIKRWCRGSMS